MYKMVKKKSVHFKIDEAVTLAHNIHLLFRSEVILGGVPDECYLETNKKVYISKSALKERPLFNMRLTQIHLAVCAPFCSGPPADHWALVSGLPTYVAENGFVSTFSF